MKDRSAPIDQVQQITTKTYQLCKQKSGDSSNPIEVLESGSDKQEIYTHTREQRKANSGNGYFYWMRIVTTRDLNKQEGVKMYPETNLIN